MRKNDMIAYLQSVPGNPHIVVRNDDHYRHDLVYKATHIPDFESTGSGKLPNVIELDWCSEGSIPFVEQADDFEPVLVDQYNSYVEYFKMRQPT
jgi:hypothetical protein